MDENEGLPASTYPAVAIWLGNLCGHEPNRDQVHAMLEYLRKIKNERKEKIKEKLDAMIKFNNESVQNELDEEKQYEEEQRQIALAFFESEELKDIIITQKIMETKAFELWIEEKLKKLRKSSEVEPKTGRDV